MPKTPLTTRYEHDLAIFRGFWPKVGLICGVAIALAYPFLASASWLTVGTLALVMVVGAVALMILTGFTGQISLGHAAFLALGAYTAGIAGGAGYPFFLVLPLGGLVAAGVGLAVGAFALRLKGLYLAVVTLGLLFLVKHLLHAFPDLTGGSRGLAVPVHGWFAGEDAGVFGTLRTPLTLGPITLEPAQHLFLLFLVIAAVTVWVGRNIQRSNTGRAMMAVRDRDMAASALGVHPAQIKMIAFGVSSFFAGVAGVMLAWQYQMITVDPPFNLFMSVNYIAIIVLGGVGTIFGAVAGGIFFAAMAPLAERIGPHIPYLAELSSHQQSTVLFAVIVISFLLFEPLGLFGVWLRIKRYFMAWPFKY